MADRTSIRVKTTGIDSVSGAAVNSTFTLGYIRNDIFSNNEINDAVRRSVFVNIGKLINDTVTGGVIIQETDVNVAQSLSGGVSDNGDDNTGTNRAGKVR